MLMLQSKSIIGYVLEGRDHDNPFEARQRWSPTGVPCPQHAVAESYREDSETLHAIDQGMGFPGMFVFGWKHVENSRT
jgi:hypothetical protein